MEEKIKLFNSQEELKNIKDEEFIVFIGYDTTEDAATKMLANSIRARTKNKDLKIFPIIRSELLAYDKFNRKLDPNGSTEFSITRFLVPHLTNFKGKALFLDADMLITRDILDILKYYDEKYAVCVVKHNYTPSSNNKMGGLNQSVYPRKNWSSVMLFNCEHPSNTKLTRKFVETATPAELHRFTWLNDEEIGGLPLEYNFLVGEEKKVDGWLPFNVHHTLGAPIFRDCQDVDFAEYWKYEFKNTFNRNFAEEDIIN